MRLVVRIRAKRKGGWEPTTTTHIQNHIVRLDVQPADHFGGKLWHKSSRILIGLFV